MQYTFNDRQFRLPSNVFMVEALWDKHHGEDGWQKTWKAQVYVSPAEGLADMDLNKVHELSIKRVSTSEWLRDMGEMAMEGMGWSAATSIVRVLSERYDRAEAKKNGHVSG
jgi:hypothetical protein